MKLIYIFIRRSRVPLNLRDFEKSIFSRSLVCDSFAVKMKKHLLIRIPVYDVSWRLHENYQVIFTRRGRRARETKPFESG